jgi:hypothetical protein
MPRFGNSCARWRTNRTVIAVVADSNLFGRAGLKRAGARRQMARRRFLRMTRMPLGTEGTHLAIGGTAPKVLNISKQAVP